MRVGCLVSGGKDSWYATYLASRMHEIKCLISIKPQNMESYMYHVPNVHLVEKQAECAEIQLIQMPSSGEKEKEVEDLKQAVELAKARFKIEGVVCGAVRSNYQKERVERICKDLNLKLICPLWNKDEDYYMHELLLSRFSIIITAVAADGFNEGWLGKKLDARALQKLRELKKRFRISLCGDGGEYESFVLDCPLFRKRIGILSSEKVMEEENSGYLKITRAEVRDK